jgi:hypothetical protein
MVARFGTEWEDNVDYAYDEAGYNYDALSRTFAGAGFGTTHKFTGKERDSESGLDYFGGGWPTRHPN